MESPLRAKAGAPDLKLIETLRWDGAVFARLDLHLARLESSATALGWACGDAWAALQAAAPMNPARVRLTLDGHGRFEITSSKLPAGPSRWRLGLAAQRLRAQDAWLTVKSTNRAAYDHARATLPTGLDEVIFQNEQGDICDGTITTVFFDRGAGLRTPPLTCGVLPGVLRADLLAAGAAHEEVLHVSDLGHVQLWVGNSLRGLFPALFIPSG